MRKAQFSQFLQFCTVRTVEQCTQQKAAAAINTAVGSRGRAQCAGMQRAAGALYIPCVRIRLPLAPSSCPSSPSRSRLRSRPCSQRAQRMSHRRLCGSACYAPLQSSTNKQERECCRARSTCAPLYPQARAHSTRARARARAVRGIEHRAGSSRRAQARSRAAHAAGSHRTSAVQGRRPQRTEHSQCRSAGRQEQGSARARRSARADSAVQGTGRQCKGAGSGSNRKWRRGWRPFRDENGKIILCTLQKISKLF